MNQAEKLELYELHTGLLTKIAVGIARKHRLPFQDMCDQATLLFFEKIDKWDPKKAKLTTFMHTAIHNGLVDYGSRVLKREMDYHITQSTSTKKERYNDSKAKETLSFIDNFSFVSNDARTLVHFLLMGACDSIKSLRETAINELGFTRKRWSQAVKEIRQTLS